MGTGTHGGSVWLCVVRCRFSLGKWGKGMAMALVFIVSSIIHEQIIACAIGTSTRVSHMRSCCVAGRTACRPGCVLFLLLCGLFSLGRDGAPLQLLLQGFGTQCCCSCSVVRA